MKSKVLCLHLTDDDSDDSDDSTRHDTTTTWLDRRQRGNKRRKKRQNGDGDETHAWTSKPSWMLSVWHVQSSRMCCSDGQPSARWDLQVTLQGWSTIERLEEPWTL